MTYPLDHAYDFPTVEDFPSHTNVETTMTCTAIATRARAARSQVQRTFSEEISPRLLRAYATPRAAQLPDGGWLGDSQSPLSRRHSVVEAMLGRLSRLVGLLAISVAGLIVADPAFACQCGTKPTVEEAYASAEIVAFGKVVAIKDQWTWWRRVKDWFRDTSKL